MFYLINKAKKQRQRPLANIAFAILLKKALQPRSGLFFMWECSSHSSNYDDIKKDLLVISDGKNYACLPAPILKEPFKFRALCKKEYPKLIHNRKFCPKPVLLEDVSILQQTILNCYKDDIKKLLDSYFVPGTVPDYFLNVETLNISNLKTLHKQKI